MDIGDNDSIISCISSLKPSCIIHLAAISSLVVCNNDNNQADQCNSPIAMIDSIKQYCPDCLFVFSSTDLIYDNGLNPPYQATTLDSVSYLPLNIYGQTKLNFEKSVLQLNNGIVLRLSNMISNKPYAYEDVGVKFLQFLQNSMDSKSFIGISIVYSLIIDYSL
jgi:dTDP-4-dehydrorhamnose reductase